MILTVENEASLVTGYIGDEHQESRHQTYFPGCIHGAHIAAADLPDVSSFKQFSSDVSERYGAKQVGDNYCYRGVYYHLFTLRTAILPKNL